MYGKKLESTCHEWWLPVLPRSLGVLLLLAPRRLKPAVSLPSFNPCPFP
jgi:hypothetical protein